MWAKNLVWAGRVLCEGGDQAGVVVAIGFEEFLLDLAEGADLLLGREGVELAFELADFLLGLLEQHFF